MLQTIRNIALYLCCFSGLTGCGFFSDKHSDEAVRKRASDPGAGPATHNYPELTADQWVNLSRTLYQEGKYLESIGAAQTALHLKPDFALAYNNIGAAYAALRLWDPAIVADRQAVQLAPGMQLAKNNLAWALTQKALDKR
jgi:tetratricopeptide (TPR) repeat protein